MPTVSITLDDQLAAKLAARAAELGVEPATYVVKVLATDLDALQRRNAAIERRGARRRDGLEER